MPFQIVILWTDWLIFLLVAVIAVTIVYVRGREHLLAPWRRVGRSASGMVGLTVLLMFVTAGLLDSLHYRPRLAGNETGAKVVYAAEVNSVLDAVLEPLRTRREKTYSAPLATELFAMEMIERADGSQMRDYPRLKFGGAQLKKPAEEWSASVARAVVGGAAAGAVMWLFVALFVAAMIAQKTSTNIHAAWAALWPRDPDTSSRTRWRAVGTATRARARPERSGSRRCAAGMSWASTRRSEEHTSELQSH